MAASLPGGLGTGRWQTRALPPRFLAQSPHGCRNRSDINGSPINNPKARGGELVPAQHCPQPTQSQGWGCLHCAQGISNASCSLPAMGFPGSCPLGQCHGRSLSHEHALDPSLMAFLGDTLHPSSSSCPMPIAGILLQPSQQSPGQSSSSDQEPQQGLGRDIPVLTTADQQLFPGCTPTPLS